jgi:hypothetical protein
MKFTGLADRRSIAFFWAPMRRYQFSGDLAATAVGRPVMTDRSQEITQDNDLRNLARIVSACTLGLWAFAGGLLIGVFLFQ